MTISFVELLLYAGRIFILFITPGPVWVAIVARTLSGGFMIILRWVACLIFLFMGISLICNADREIHQNSHLTNPGVSAGFFASLAVILNNPKAILSGGGQCETVGLDDERRVCRQAGAVVHGNKDEMAVE